MITINLQRISKIKGIEHPYAFLARNGFTHYVAHTLVNSAGKNIRFDHLEKLCRIYHCLPHDLFDYAPKGRGLNPDNDILLPLRKKPLPTKGLNSLVASLPPDDILNLTDELQARFNKPQDQPATEPTNGQ